MQLKYKMTELKIIEEKENPLFKRKEIIAEMDAEVTPSNADITKKISEKYSKEEKAIKVYSIKGKYGRKNTTIKAKVYDSPEELNRIEVKTKKQREAEAKAAEEAKKAEEEAKKKAKESEEKKEGENEETSEENKEGNKENQ